jgi:hypothetical protein
MRPAASQAAAAVDVTTSEGNLGTAGGVNAKGDERQDVVDVLGR